MEHIVKLTKTSAGEILCCFNEYRKRQCCKKQDSQFPKLSVQTRQQEPHRHQHEDIAPDLLCPVKLSVGCEKFPQFPKGREHCSAFTPLSVNQRQPQNNKEIHQKHCNEQFFSLTQRSHSWQDFSAYPHQIPCRLTHSRTAIAAESQQDCLQKGYRFSEYIR